TTALGIGGDPVIGTTHIDALEAFENDPDTAGIVMIGEIGGDAAGPAPAHSTAHDSEPGPAYVAGAPGPGGAAPGHAGPPAAGSIVSGSAGTAQAKKEALEAAGVKVGKTPTETADLMREIIKGLS